MNSPREPANEIREPSSSESLKPQRRPLLDDRRTKILHWLGPADQQQTHKRVAQSRVDGTGRWILQHELYVAWKKQQNKQKMLLLIGESGAGKTVLA